MIELEKIEVLIAEFLEGTDKFTMEAKVKTGNLIAIKLDGETQVTIDDCIKLSKFIENSLDREEQDFELRVSSFGADSALKVLRQYIKHIGRDLDLILTDEEKVKGKLMQVHDNSITIQNIVGKKKKGIEEEDRTISFDDIKEAKVILSFK